MGDQSNNVVMFPKGCVSRKTYVPDKKTEDNAKESYVNHIIDHYAQMLLKNFSLHGIDVSTKDFDKQFALAIECLRASVYKSYGIQHPLHEPMSELIRAIESWENEPEHRPTQIIIDDPDEPS